MRTLTNLTLSLVLLALLFTSCESDSPENTEPQKLLVPVEITNENGTQTYKYDNSLRLVETFLNSPEFSFSQSWQINYNGSKVSFITYDTFDGTPNTPRSHEYSFTYNQDTVFYERTKINNMSEDEKYIFLGYYVIDTNGHILKNYYKHGLEAPIYSTFEYDNNKNLTGIKYDTEDNETNIKASYDTQRAIMFNVNAPQWLLYFMEGASPLGASMYNNILEYKHTFPNGKENRTYTYQYNSQGFPESVVMEGRYEFYDMEDIDTTNTTIRYEEKEMR